MELAYRQLSGDEIQEGLNALNGWSVEGERIAKTFEFGEYLQGADFGRKVADTANALDHHPDIEIGYKKVRVSVNTHSVGGLSPYDFELAKRIDQLLA
jgi:4a-hydroxytetrahydrobiopterin dehydratase